MNKYLRILSLAVLGVLMTGCWTARIWTVVPTKEPVAPVATVYTTKVITPSPKVTTVTTFTVTNYSTDPCFYLDLNAVAAAFAESRTVAEFEQILNSSRYMINNLDLNRDGWIDYLRVIETHRGVYHTFLIQACLAPSVYQDVATLVAEHRPEALYVEVVGDRWLYGPSYIVRPVFVKRPPLWDVFGRPAYAVWSSPYYYGYWPSYYKKPKPVYLNHYQAYVNTYLTNHHYCHRCDYPSQPFYKGYVQMTQADSHNDYATSHPNESFEQRVTHQLTANGSGVTVRNAGQLRTEVSRQTAAETGSTSRTSTSGSSASSRQSSDSTPRQTTTTTRQNSSSQSAPRQASTSVDTRVNKSGTTRTTIKTTDENGRTQTVQRTSSTTRSSSRTSSSSVRSSQGTTRESSPRSTRRGR